jgi:hypothetical protein
MRLPEGRQSICPGVSYTLKANRDLSISIDFNVKWYGYPVLAWKTVHKENNFKWYHYPVLVWLIAKHTILYWFNRDKG